MPRWAAEPPWLLLLPQLRFCSGCWHIIMPGTQHVSYDTGQHLCWSCYQAGMEAIVIDDLPRP